MYVPVCVCTLMYMCWIRSIMRKLRQHSSISLNNVEEVVKGTANSPMHNRCKGRQVHAEKEFCLLRLMVGVFLYKFIEIRNHFMSLSHLSDFLSVTHTHTHTHTHTRTKNEDLIATECQGTC